ncbi:MAG: GHMP kinase, partial [Candidatus Aminicenantes bacterium]|nr:GHMP kinase [Candidatus Aminicenantes bacterium]
LISFRSIRSTAPLRVNDIGGWTDTWFSGTGNVLNLAVAPGVQVDVVISDNPRNLCKRVRVFALDFGTDFLVDPDNPDYGTHQLLQGALHSLPIPQDLCLEIYLKSAVPAGISVGTSASVCVALIGAVARLTSLPTDPARIAKLAHQVETEKLLWQSGIQDQICAAFGGVCFIHMPEYPQAEIEKIDLPIVTYLELSKRLCLIYLGRSHNSSALHEQVIAALEDKASLSHPLLRLQELPDIALEYLLQEDLESYGQVMVENNECQRDLHADLISPYADRVIAIARKYHACGWKVNGAGGQGGSLSLLADSDPEKQEAMLAEITALGGGIRRLPVALSREGLEVVSQKL